MRCSTFGHYEIVDEGSDREQYKPKKHSRVAEIEAGLYGIGNGLRERCSLEMMFAIECRIGHDF